MITGSECDDSFEPDPIQSTRREDLDFDTESFATSFRDPRPGGHLFAGPRIRARSWREAERKAERIGCVVIGYGGGYLDAETLEEIEESVCVGAVDERRRALACGSRGNRFTRWLPRFLRRFGERTLTFADRIDPVKSRRRVVTSSR